MRIRTASAALLPLGLILTACTPTAVPGPAETENYVSATDAPTDTTTVEAGPVEPDTTLIVRATAIAANGARLALEMRVHQSVRFDDVAGQTLPTAIAQDCAGALDATVFAQQLWSFTRGNITAIPTADSTATWPTDAAIAVRPSGQYASVAGRGMLASDAAASATPLCRVERTFASAGKGAFAMGVPADVVDAGADGGFVKWAGHSFGFAIPAGSTASLADCSYELTELGSQFGPLTASWVPVATGSGCYVGPDPETTD